MWGRLVLSSGTKHTAVIWVQDEKNVCIVSRGGLKYVFF